MLELPLFSTNLKEILIARQHQSLLLTNPAVTCDGHFYGSLNANEKVPLKGLCRGETLKAVA